MIRFTVNRAFGGRMTSMPRWATWLTMAASIVVGIALFLLAASLALILIPLVLTAGAVAAWRLRSRLKAAGFPQGAPFGPRAKGDSRLDIIDVEYRIIDQGEPPRR